MPAEGPRDLKDARPWLPLVFPCWRSPGLAEQGEGAASLVPPLGLAPVTEAVREPGARLSTELDGTKEP